MDIRPLRTPQDHEAALREIDRLWGALPDTDDGDRLDVMAVLVERYEDAHYPMPRVEPVDVLRFVMEQNGRTQADLADLFGSRSRASEVLNGKRALTLEQIRSLQRHWHIPAGALIGNMADA